VPLCTELSLQRQIFLTAGKRRKEEKKEKGQGGGEEIE